MSQIGLGEILARKEKGEPGCFSDCVGEAVAEVQRGRVAAFAESGIGMIKPDEMMRIESDQLDVEFLKETGEKGLGIWDQFAVEDNECLCGAGSWKEAKWSGQELCEQSGSDGFAGENGDDRRGVEQDGRRILNH